MPETPVSVIGGVDTHSRTHHAVALDDRGERLGDAEFPATARGYRELHQWLEAFGTIATIAVEGTSSYGAGLTRWLLAQGLAVREVNQPHRHTRRRQGKSDPIDAEAAARQVLAGTAQVLPKATNGVAESIRTLANARSAAVKARSAALLQLRDLIATAPAELREALPQQSLPAKARQCARFRPDRARLDQPLQAAKLALRSVAHRVAELDRQSDGNAYSSDGDGNRSQRGSSTRSEDRCPEACRGCARKGARRRAPRSRPRVACGARACGRVRRSPRRSRAPSRLRRARRRSARRGPRLQLWQGRSRGAATASE